MSAATVERSVLGETTRRDRRRGTRVDAAKRGGLSLVSALRSTGNADAAQAEEPDERPTAVGSTAVLSPRSVKLWLVLADVVSICVGVAAAFAIQDRFDTVKQATTETQQLLGLAAIPLFVGAACMSNMYRSRANSRFRDEVTNIVRTVLLGAGAMVAFAFVLRFDDVSRFWVAAVLGSVGFMLFAERRLAHRIFRSLRRSGRMSRRVLLVGTDQYALDLYHRICDRQELGYHAVGFVDVIEGGDTEFCGIPVLGHVDRAKEIAHEQGAIGVIISLSSVCPDTVNTVTRQLTDAGLHVTLSTGLEDIDVHRLRTQQLGRRSMIYIEPTIRTGWRRLAKRGFDVSVAVGGLILAAPVLVLAAIAIRLESPGPILFRQERIGLNGQRFRMIKLRTMVAEAEAMKTSLLDQNESDGPLFKIRHDPRITRVGRVLRKTSIDELPQFWNVLRRDMSVVGPRPALPNEVAEWAPDVHERLRVLPGITGMWQVSGRASSTFSEYKRLDLYYVDNWSLAHDLRIVCKTFLAVVHGRGAS